MTQTLIVFSDQTSVKNRLDGSIASRHVGVMINTAQQPLEALSIRNGARLRAARVDTVICNAFELWGDDHG